MPRRLATLECTLFGVLLAASVAGCSIEPPTSATRVESAYLTLGANRPTGVRFGGQQVGLPDRWPAIRRRRATEGWYRMEVDLARTGEPVGVLVTRARLNSEVFFNGTSLGRTGSFEPPITRTPAVPLYFSVPDVLVREGRNEIAIHLATTLGFPGSLHPLWVGPDSALRPVYEREYLVNAQAPRAGLILAWVIATILLGEALSNRGDRQAAFFLGGAALLMTFSGTGYLVSDNPIPSRLWEWLVGCSTHWASFLLVLSTHRFLELSRPRLERTFFVGFLAASALFAAVPYAWAFAVWVMWFAGTVAVFAYLLVLLVRGVRRGQLHPSVPIVAVLAVSPWVGMAARGILFAAAAGCWLVLARTYRRMRATEALNRELAVRVAERERDLRESYDRLGELERARVIGQERERLMRDMHDGTGGQLASALAMARSSRAERENIADILQETLDDLRLTIESLDPEARDVSAVLGMMRASLERRLLPAGTRLVWRVGDAGSNLALGSENALHLIRIVQEAVTNTIKHAAASEVTIETQPGPNGGVVVRVRDDGSGSGDAAEGGSGRGLGNMRSRAATMGGRLCVESNAEGTSVILSLS